MVNRAINSVINQRPIFVIFILLSTLLSASFTNAAIPTEQLIRSIQIGALQDIKLLEVIEAAHDESASYTDYVLARATLLTIGEYQNQFPAWQPARLLDRSLDQLVKGHNSSIKPAGFRNEHLIFTLSYAMIMAGQHDQVIDVLERHLDTRVDYKRAVVLQTLRHIGSKPATELIQQIANEKANDSDLATNLLADYRYPFLHQLAGFQQQIPVTQRNTSELLQLARTDACGIPASLAVYWLGFATTQDRQQEEQIQQLLRQLNGIDCYYTRYFARRSLALRSTESLEFWIEQYVAEIDPWQRALLTRIGFARFGREFAEIALDLLSSEVAQYVQWELMHGYFEHNDTPDWLGYWDLWLTPSLQFRLDQRPSETLDHSSLETLLSWLEAGNRAEHEWVQNHLMYRLVSLVEGAQLIRLLDVFADQPDFHQHWWILHNIDDAAALPHLELWQQRYSQQEPNDQLKSLIDKLRSKQSL